MFPFAFPFPFPLALALPLAAVTALAPGPAMILLSSSWESLPPLTVSKKETGTRPATLAFASVAGLQTSYQSESFSRAVT